MRLMIVDDDRSTVDSICKLIDENRLAFSCLLPPDVEEALSMLKTHHTNCVILGPSSRNQLSITRRCRSIRRSLPIIAVTPERDADQAERLLRAGAQECPCMRDLTPETLNQCIRCATARVFEEPPLEHELLFQTALGHLDAQLCLVNSMGVIVESIGWNVGEAVRGIGEVGSNVYDNLRRLARNGHGSAQMVATALRDIFAGRAESFVTEVPAFEGPGRWVQVRLLAIREGDTSTAAILQRDVTEERLGHQELERLAKRTDLVTLAANHVEDALLITDRDVKIEWVNEAFERIYGYTLDEIRGKTPQELLHGPHTNLQVIESIQRAIDGNCGLDFEIKHYTKSGATIWASVQMKPLFDSQGQLKRRIAVIRDVTSQILAERDRDTLRQQLLESSRRAGMADTATCILHNVGNVLNSVNVTARALESRIRENSSDRLLRFADRLLACSQTRDVQVGREEKLLPEYVASISQAIRSDREVMLKEVRELQQQVGHLNEIVVMQQSLATGNSLVRECDIIELVDDAIRINEAGLKRHHVEVVREYHARPKLNCQMHKVLQILVNLISNAKYAMSDSENAPAVMRVRVDNRDDRVRIAISDNGVGIARENLVRVFELGFTTREAGHGYGLHSSANAAKEIGGTLSAKSDGVGQGATFCLEIPAQRNEDELCSPIAVPLDKY